MRKTIGTRRQKRLAQLLTEQREAIGLTQMEMAKRLSVFQSRIARLESGQRRVDIVEFLDIAKALDLDPHEALNELLAIKE